MAAQQEELHLAYPRADSPAAGLTRAVVGTLAPVLVARTWLAEVEVVLPAEGPRWLLARPESDDKQDSGGQRSHSSCRSRTGPDCRVPQPQQEWTPIEPWQIEYLEDASDSPLCSMNFRQVRRAQRQHSLPWRGTTKIPRYSIEGGPLAQLPPPVTNAPAIGAVAAIPRPE